jgi:tRNA(Arg) A34 adenosine deaminase TadA
MGGKSIMFPDIRLGLPDWVWSEVGNPNRRFPRLNDRMELAIRLSERNTTESTGGPFGAIVFERDSGKLVAPGVNVVVPEQCSVAHAEAMAIMLAEKALQAFNLGAPGLPAMELVTSAQPCIQCFGIIWWSGISRLVSGATGEDVERLTGFKEGPLPVNWTELLADRPPLPPVETVTACLRSRASDVLRKYTEAGGRIYNPGSGSTEQGAPPDS